MRCVLIVEDETITRSILARVASTIPGISALAVGSIQEARAALEVARPDVAIIDLHLPDGLGFEVLKWLDDKGGVVMAIITSAHLHEHERELSASRGRLRCMPKPIDYAELKRVLTSVMSAGVFFHGPFAPVEYVQIAGSGGYNVKLACYDPAGVPIGDIIMSAGRVWSAETPHASGLQALRELVARLDARVRLEAASNTSGPANVDRDWHVAVLDAMAPERDDITQVIPGAALALERALAPELESMSVKNQLERLHQLRPTVKQ
jgi:CheY-like chemotaxis protein